MVILIEMQKVMNLIFDVYNRNFIICKILNLSHNNISKLSTSFLNLVSLEELYLSYNKFREIPNVIFDLENIKKLFIDGNRHISQWTAKNILKNC
mgnify:CR=1 FL=1